MKYFELQKNHNTFRKPSEVLFYFFEFNTDVLPSETGLNGGFHK